MKIDFYFYFYFSFFIGDDTLFSFLGLAVKNNSELLSTVKANLLIDEGLNRSLKLFVAHIILLKIIRRLIAAGEFFPANIGLRSPELLVTLHNLLIQTLSPQILRLAPPVARLHLRLLLGKNQILIIIFVINGLRNRGFRVSLADNLLVLVHNLFF